MKRAAFLLERKNNWVGKISFDRGAGVNECGFVLIHHKIPKISLPSPSSSSPLHFPSSRLSSPSFPLSFTPLFPSPPPLFPSPPPLFPSPSPSFPLPSPSSPLLRRFSVLWCALCIYIFINAIFLCSSNTWLFNIFTCNQNVVVTNSLLRLIYHNQG